MPSPLASCIKAPVASRTCDTLPGEDDIFSLYIVWIESITTTCGFPLRSTASITSRFVSQSKDRLSVNCPILCARILICCKDSSPEIYNTIMRCALNFWHTCKSSVDFPMPGSPPTSTSDAGTIPPPSTRSSSGKPLAKRSSRCNVMSLSTTGLASCTSFCGDMLFFCATGSSTNVFHCLHPGHCPSHFADSCPHSWQK